MSSPSLLSSDGGRGTTLIVAAARVGGGTLHEGDGEHDEQGTKEGALK